MEGLIILVLHFFRVNEWELHTLEHTCPYPSNLRRLSLSPSKDSNIHHDDGVSHHHCYIHCILL